MPITGRLRHVKSYVCGSTNYVIMNVQIRRNFHLDLTTRWYVAIAFPLTVYLPDHHFRNTSLTTLLYSRSSHTYVSHIRKSRISPQIWCMFPILCSHYAVQFNVFPCHVDTGVAILINRYTVLRNVPANVDPCYLRILRSTDSYREFQFAFSVTWRD